jgi:hypothetical protein
LFSDCGYDTLVLLEKFGSIDDTGEMVQDEKDWIVRFYIMVVLGIVSKKKQRTFANSQHGDPGCSLWDLVTNQDEGIACYIYEFYHGGAQRRCAHDNDNEDGFDGDDQREDENNNDVTGEADNEGGGVDPDSEERCETIVADDNLGDGDGDVLKSVSSDAEELSVAGTHASVSTRSSSKRVNAGKMSSWQNLRFYKQSCDWFGGWHSRVPQSRKNMLDRMVREALTGKTKKERNKPVLLVLRTLEDNCVGKDAAFDYMMCGKGPFG